MKACDIGQTWVSEPPPDCYPSADKLVLLHVKQYLEAVLKGARGQTGLGLYCLSPC